MRVLISADHHWDEHRRFDECVRVHTWMADLARREQVDLFLSAGDIYERASTPMERSAAAEWLTMTAEACPVVISKGNHDRPRDCELLGKLRTRHPVLVEERAGVHIVAGAAVAAVAWPDRAALAASVQARDAETVDLAARDAFRALLLGLRNELAAHDGPRVGLGHFMVDGSVVSTGQPLLGMPLNLGLSDLALLDAPLIACGHIHMAQEWRFGESLIFYPGSPFRTDFGQLEEKSVAIATFDGRWLVNLERIPTPCTRMEHFEATWMPEGLLEPGLVWSGGAYPSLDRVEGAECRLRWRVPADRRDAAKQHANELRSRMLADGAVSVKVEEVVIPTTRARAPEIAAATRLSDKLRCLWTSRSDDLPEERRARLLGKVAQLEEETTDAVHV